ncbi:MAG: hypothetical protein ACI89L_002257 [Phycisphaerales bacterium]|jgi:hypothetical protein
MDEERTILLGKTKPKRSLRLLCVRGLCAILVLLMCGWLLVAQSPLTRMILVPQIESYLSVIADCKKVRIGLDGVVHVKGLRLTVPGFARPGQPIPDQARFFEIEEAQVYLDWGGVFSGKPKVDRVVVDGGLIRLSQSAQTGQLNVSGLALFSGSSTDQSLQLPQLAAAGFTFEIGEHHDDGSYTKLRTVKVEGELKPPTEDGVNVFELKQTAESVSWSSGQPVAIPMRDPFTVSGQLGPDGVRGILKGVELDEWRPEDLPGPVRGVLNQLYLSGQIAEVSGELTPAGDFRLFMQVNGVGVTLPFSPGNGSEQRARLTDTSGLIRVDSDGLHGDISGQLQGLNYTVDLDFMGFDANAAFTCTLNTDFHLQDNLEALVFAPTEVIEKLSWFGNPVADVEAQIVVARGATTDGVVPATDVSGTIRFTNGTSAYKNFVYPFVNMTGLARFTRDELVIEELTGRGPTGAVMSASARFSPLGEDSEADILVKAHGVRIDQHLLDALSGSRRQMVEQLFNEDRYRELLNAGLVLLPEERARLETRSGELNATLAALPAADPGRAAMQLERDEINGQLRTPSFAFGGSADVEVTIHRELGLVSNWTKDIRVTLDRVGIVPKYFPLPMVAHDVLLRVDDSVAELGGGVFTGINGGHATVTTTIALVDEEGNSLPDAMPTIHLAAQDVPIDPRLLAAIPGYRGTEPGQGLRGVLDRLSLTGFVDAVADIEPRENGELGFEIHVPVDRIVATPSHAPTRADEHPGVRIIPTTGSILAREDRVVVDLGGELIDLAGVEPPAPIEMRTEILFVDSKAGFGGRRPSTRGGQFGPPRPGPTLKVETRAESLGLSLPVEDLAAVVNESTATRLAEMRERRRPEGYADLSATFSGHIGGAVEGLTVIDGGHGLAVNVGDSRVRVGELEGEFSLKTGAEPFQKFDAVSGNLEVDGDPGGTFELNGVLPQAVAGMDPARFHAANPRLWDDGLTVTLTRGRFESGLTDLTARSKLTEATHEWYEALDLHGAYTANLRIDPVRAPVDPGVFPGTAVMPPLEFSGVLEPRAARFIYEGTPIQIDTVSGLVGFEGTEGWIDRLIGETRDWRFELSGPWRVEPGYGFFIDAMAQIDVTAIDDPLRALMPEAVVDGLAAFEFEPGDGLSVRDLSLRMDIVADEELPLFDTTGRVELRNSAGRVGVGMTELSGGFGFEASNREGHPEFEIRLGLDRARAAGVRLVNITGRAHNLELPGVMRVDGLVAECHGGRLVASIRTDLNEITHPYTVDLRLTGARASPVFSDLGVGPDRVPDLENIAATELLAAFAAERLAWKDSGDHSRGIMDAGVTVSGESLDKSALHGRGRLEIHGGSLVDVPGLLPIIELSNLTLPSGSRLDKARAEFYLRGNTVYLDELTASSDAIELYGGGTLLMPEVEMDVWMRSRALKKIPILSDLFGAVRDEIVTATIKGTPADLKISTMQFADTRRVLSELLGNNSGPSRDRRDVGRGRIESRPPPRPVPPVPPVSPVSPVSGDEGDYTIAGHPAQQEDASHD